MLNREEQRKEDEALIRKVFEEVMSSPNVLVAGQLGEMIKEYARRNV